MSNDDETSESLLRCYVEGDVQALATLYERHKKELRRFVFHMLGHFEEWIQSRGDDVCAEVWRTVARAARTFEGRCSFRTWLFTIASQKCRGHLKRHHQARERQPARGPDGKYHVRESEPDRSAPVPEVVAQGEFAADLGSALQALPPRQREVFVLRSQRELTWDEVSQSLGERKDVLRARLDAALRALRSRLRRYGPSSLCRWRSVA